MADDATEGTPDEGGSQNTPAEKLIPQSQVDRIVQDRVARTEKKYADYEDLKGKASKFEEFEQSQKSELEKAQQRATEAEQAAEQARQTAQDSLLQAAVVAAAANKKVVDPDAAVALIDRAAITFDGGKPQGVTEALESLVEAKPWLVDAGTTRVASADQGARGDAEAGQLSRAQLSSMTPEQIVDAQQKGLLKHALSG